MTVIFAIVDRPGAKPNRTMVIVDQKRERKEGDLIMREETDVISPNKAGMFLLDDSHPNHKKRLAVLKKKMARENAPGQPPKLIGPFEDDGDDVPVEKNLSAFQKAQMELYRVRPRSEKEQIMILTAEHAKQEEKLEAERKQRETLEAEIAAMKAELAKREAAKAGNKGKKDD